MHTITIGDEDDVKLLPPPNVLSDCPEYVRAGFLRRVYGLVSCQLVVNGTIATWLMLDETARSWLQPEVVTVCAFVALALVCVQPCSARSHPWNVLLLAAFTLAESVVVGGVCAAYASHGLSMLVAAAFATTTALFVMLTLFVLLRRRDLHFLGAWLCGALLTLGGLVLVDWISGPFELNQLLIAGGGMLTFSGFVLYDTSMMLHRLGPDDAVDAALQLYLDVINLFFCALEFFRPSSSN